MENFEEGQIVIIFMQKNVLTRILAEQLTHFSLHAISVL